MISSYPNDRIGKKVLRRGNVSRAYNTKALIANTYRPLAGTRCSRCGLGEAITQTTCRTRRSKCHHRDLRHRIVPSAPMQRAEP